MAESMYPDGPSTAQGNTIQYPMMSKKELDDWYKRGNVVKVGKDYDLEDAMRNNPDGFMVEAKHPGINSLHDKANIMSIPMHQDYIGGMLFVKPKKGSTKTPSPSPELPTYSGSMG